MKLFQIEVSALRVSTELGGVQDGVEAVHSAAAGVGQGGHGQEPLVGEVEADESPFRERRRGKQGRGAVGKTPVFGIPERDGKVPVEVAPSVRAEELRSLWVAKVTRGNLVYTDRFKGYDGRGTYGFRHDRIEWPGL